MNNTLRTNITSMTSLSELNEVIDLCDQVKRINAKTSLVEGQNVYVVEKTKRTLGVLEKIKISRAIVRLPHGSFSVPLTMLEVA
jgi:hypothetical protein